MKFRVGLAFDGGGEGAPFLGADVSSEGDELFEGGFAEVAGLDVGFSAGLEATGGDAGGHFGGGTGHEVYVAVDFGGGESGFEDPAGFAGGGDLDPFAVAA